MLKVGDKFKWQEFNGEWQEDVVRAIDNFHTTLPELTIWCESGGWLRSSDCIKIEEENRWTKIVEALKAQIDSALGIGEIEQAVRYAKLLDEVKSNV